MSSWPCCAGVESLRPEFPAHTLGFTRFMPDVWCEITELHLANEVARLHSVGFDLEVSREALEFLIREGFHPQLGDRPLRQTIENNRQDAVTSVLVSYGIGSGRIEPDPVFASRLRFVPNRLGRLLLCHGE